MNKIICSYFYILFITLLIVSMGLLDCVDQPSNQNLEAPIKPEKTPIIETKPPIHEDVFDGKEHELRKFLNKDVSSSNISGGFLYCVGWINGESKVVPTVYFAWKETGYNEYIISSLPLERIDKWKYEWPPKNSEQTMKHVG
jgi:hypothetical protein